MKDFLTRMGFVFLVMAGIMGFMGFREMSMSFSEPVDINVDYPSDYNEVKAVETDINILLGTFAEEETTTKNKSGAITSRDYDYFYVIPVFTEDETYYAGVKVDSDDSAPYDEIVNLTWDYFNGETDELGNKSVHFQGGFLEMEDELYKYFKDWFEEEQYFESEADMNKYLLPLVLEPFQYSSMRTMTYVMVGLVVLGILLLVLGLRSGKKYKAPANSVINIDGVNYPSSNFESVNKLVEKGNTDKAVKELQKITGMEEANATLVISRWNEYWG